MRLTSSVPRRLFRSAAMVVATLLVVSGLMAVAPAPQARAAELPSTITDGGFIISDAEFFNGNAMTPAQAQKFLETRVPTCKATTGPDCLRNFTADLPAKAKDSYCSAIAAKKKVRASEIIVTVGKACGLSPKVILVMLQKEQGLVTSTKPSDWSYRASMGMNCPDTAPCSAASAGFVNQVYLGARQQQVYADNPTRYGYRAGQVNTVKWHPNSACGTSKVFIKNQATANLYIYTPYRPNIAALAAGYATGDSCSSYGNRNFYNYYVQWFAPQVSPNASGAPARVGECTVPVKADVVGASGTATVTAATTARKAPTASCTSGTKSLAKDAGVSVKGTYGSWVQVTSGSSTLWVAKSALRMPGAAPAAGADACKLPAESSVTKASGTAVVTTESLNARKAPTTSCDTGKRSILNGQTYARTGTYGAWWRLTVSGATYWAHSDYLAVKAAPATPAPKSMFTTDVVHLRPQKSQTGITATARKGAQVSVLATQGGWSQVKLGQATGWVDAKRLVATKPAVPKTVAATTTRAVTVRIGMADSTKSVVSLTKGAKVTIVDSFSGWRAVTSGTATGWVPAASLTTATPAPKSMFTTDVVHLRPQKSQTGITATARKGAQVSVLATQGGWSQVKLGQATGWVDAKRLVATKPAVPKTVAATTTRAVTVRIGMADSTKSVVSLAKGAKVTIVDSFSGWRAVTSGTATGWVPAASLTTATPAKTTTKTTTTAVNLRSAASTSSTKITTLAAGTKVTVVSSQGIWFKVTVGTRTGWVHGDYLK
ncbi:SH3 domain-containing protein [Microbacterium oleivorans]|nr:SH3 domain-containing protein [Microbacterium oleivorans]